MFTTTSVIGTDENSKNCPQDMLKSFGSDTIRVESLELLRRQDQWRTFVSNTLVIPVRKCLFDRPEDGIFAEAHSGCGLDTVDQNRGCASS